MKVSPEKYERWKELLKRVGRDDQEIQAALDLLNWYCTKSNHIDTFFELCGLLAERYAWTLKYLKEEQQRQILGADKVPDSLKTLTAKPKLPLVDPNDRYVKSRKYTKKFKFKRMK